MEREKDPGGPGGSNDNPDGAPEKLELEKSETGISSDKESTDTQSMTSLDREKLRKALRSQNADYSYVQDKTYKEDFIQIIQGKKETTHETTKQSPSVTLKKPLPRTWPYDSREDSGDEEFKRESRERERSRHKGGNRKEKVIIKKEEIRKRDRVITNETREERTTPYVDWRLREQGSRGLRPERVKSTPLVHPVSCPVTWPWLRDWGMESSCTDFHNRNNEKEPSAHKSVSSEDKDNSRFHESKPLPENESKSRPDKTREGNKLKSLRIELEEQVKSKPFQKTIEKTDQSKPFHGSIEEHGHSKHLKEDMPKDEDIFKIVQDMIKDEDTLKAIQKIIKDQEKFRTIHEMLKDEVKLKIIQEMVNEQDKLNAIRSRSAKKEEEKMKIFYRVLQESRRPTSRKNSGKRSSAKSKEQKKKTEDNLPEEK